MKLVPMMVEGVTFMVAPTPMPKLMRAIAKMNAHGAESPEAAEAMAEAVYWGARRAKSDITLEWLLDNIDVNNVEQLAKVFAEANELEKPARGDAPGEAGAAGAG